MPPHARPVQPVPHSTNIGYTRLPGCVTQAERVLDYVWSIAPSGATNGELARGLGIRSHQTVYMLTQQLLHQGRIHGALSGTIWVFHVAEEPSTTLGAGPAWTSDTTPAVRFKALARRVLSDHYPVDLTPAHYQASPNCSISCHPTGALSATRSTSAWSAASGCQRRNSQSSPNRS